MLKKIKSETQNRYLFMGGFTLSEVMVTIAVLGVIGAILIPAITNLAPNKTKIMAKKAYSTAEKTVSMLISDDINYPSDQTYTFSSVVYPRGFNYTTARMNNVSGTVYNKFCYLLRDSLNVIGTSSCPLATAALDHSNYGTFTTSDGISWKIYIPVSDSTNNALAAASANTTSAQFPVEHSLYTTKLIIDVNGTNSPNCTADTVCSTDCSATYKLTYCASNPDTFILGVRFDGKLQIGSGGAGTDPAMETILKNPLDN